MDKRHNYVKKLLRLIEAGKIPAFVGVAHLMIYHDEWCDIYRGGFCSCDPDIEYIPPTTTRLAEAAYN